MDRMMFVCCGAAVIGGLHLLVTEKQPALGIKALDFPIIQTAVGAVLVGCGGMCLLGRSA
jgi:hypothetical protein